KPRRTASKRTTPPNNISTEAVTISAARMLFFAPPAFVHQVAVELFILLHPFDVLGAGSERRLERAVFEVFFELRCVVDLFEEAGVPLNRVLAHIRRGGDTAQHP